MEISPITITKRNYEVQRIATSIIALFISCSLIRECLIIDYFYN